MYGWSVSAHMRALARALSFLLSLLLSIIRACARVLRKHNVRFVCVVLVVCSAHEPSCVIFVSSLFLIRRCFDMLMVARLFIHSKLILRLPCLFSSFLIVVQYNNKRKLHTQTRYSLFTSFLS